MFTLRLNATKNIDYVKNCSNESCSELKFPTKNSGCSYLSLPGVELEALKIAIFEILYCTGMEK